MSFSKGITSVQARAERRPSIRFSVIARDVATMGSGTLLAAIFGTLLVFLVPRLVSVEDYGYWRLFLLYAGYVGFLHFGFADGALLRWAGRPLEEFHREVIPSLRFLVCANLAVVIPGSLVFGLVLPSTARFIGVAVFLLALIVNSVTLLQYSLQGARLFKPVAIATAAPSGIFLALAFLAGLRSSPSFRQLIVIYCVAWVGALIYLWTRVSPRHTPGSASAWGLGKACTLSGWPIVLANTGYGLVAAADRLVVGSALPIYDFAEYSLAASAMFVPVTAIAAVYRVFFSHVAGLVEESRARVYARASRLLLLAWSLLLPYYFVLEVFVRRFLPKYVPSLPIAGILLLGVVFLAEIQILHMSYFYLNGRQRQFLFQAIGALVASLSLAIVMALWRRSLAAVAIGQLTALGFWWLYNEWKLREISGQRWKDWLRVLGVFAWSAAGYRIALFSGRNIGWRIPIYYALVVSVLLFTFPNEFRFGWRLLRPRTTEPLSEGQQMSAGNHAAWFSGPRHGS